EAVLRPQRAAAVRLAHRHRGELAAVRIFDDLGRDVTFMRPVEARGPPPATARDAARRRAVGAQAGAPRAPAPTAALAVPRSYGELDRYTCQVLSCMFPLDAGDAARFAASPPADARAADRAGARVALRGVRADDSPGRRVARRRGGARRGRARAG